MEQQNIPQIKRRKHKSDFFVFDKAQGRVIKPKRLSCMKPSEYLTMEESKISVANQCIEEILLNVFDSINQAKMTSQLCLKQVQKKVELVQYFEFYNLENIEQEEVTLISLQNEPKTQPKHKVIVNKQKTSQSFIINIKKEVLGNQLNKQNPSNSKSHINLPSRQKLLSSVHFPSNRSSRSMKSIKTGRGNSFMILGMKNNESIIEEDKQNSKQKQKRRKQEIIKKLLKQHQQKLKQISHTCPQPILQQYRSFFTQPQTREQEDFRNSFLYLRQLKQSQQNLNRKKVSKRALNRSLLTESQSKQNLKTSVRLPTIYKQTDKNKYQSSVSLFAQDQNGSIIKVKNCQKLDAPSRQYSLTMHESSKIKPQQTKLRQISSVFKPKVETLNNPKIKPESQLINQNSSIVSTLCQSMDQETLEKSLFEIFGKKNGVTLKRSENLHKSSISSELQGLKLPSMVLKKS